MHRQQRPEPADAQQTERQLSEQRQLREAMQAKPKKKQPPPGRHWYKDRQYNRGIKKG